jgi:hypothetical protein
MPAFKSGRLDALTLQNAADDRVMVAMFKACIVPSITTAR